MTFIQDRRQMGDTFAGHTDLEVTVCTCGVLFAAPQKLLDTRRFDGQSFYCPNGHSLSFKGTRLEVARPRARARAARLAAARDQAEASARAQRGAATRARNQRDKDRQRVAAGVCPCCNRTFKQLARHMKSQHPEYGPLGQNDSANHPH
jgi:hypothetical protein